MKLTFVIGNGTLKTNVNLEKYYIGLKIIFIIISAHPFVQLNA